MDPASSALVRRIRTVLANHAHLDLVADEAFQFKIAEKLSEFDAASQSADVANAAAAANAEPSLRFSSGVELLCGILEHIKIPFDPAVVRSCAAAACCTFALSRKEADKWTAGRARFILDWLLRCIAESEIRQSPSFYSRNFLVGFDHETMISESGLLLAGAVTHGLYGTIWMCAKLRRAVVRQQTLTRNLTRNCSAGSNASLASSGRLSTTPSLRMQHVVISIPKRSCRLPPDLLSKQLRDRIAMEPLPYVLPLVDAYEDFQHIHLVYEGITDRAVCLSDKVFADLHIHDEAAIEGKGFSERTVQLIVLKLMSALTEAHIRGLVHGGLRMGCCYLNEADSYESLRILEFGLSDLFDMSSSVPPSTVSTPLDSDPSDPVPPYRRDLQCIAEMTFLMLGGQPICQLDTSMEERRQRFLRGTVCFADNVYAKISESAKQFVLDIVRPSNFKQQTNIQPCHEAAVYKDHAWFRLQSSQLDQLNEIFDILVMRKYDSWRSTLRFRMNFMKIVADYISLRRLPSFQEKLRGRRIASGKVSWADFSKEFADMWGSLSALTKVSRAFGDNQYQPSIHVDETCQAIAAWRRKRVRDAIWQIFSRSKAYSGTMPSRACIDGFQAQVLHVWSKPMRVCEVVFPEEKRETLVTRVEDMVGGGETVSFLDLAMKTDAAYPS